VIHTGDCVTVMRTMESESIDAIVTDPPAGISFMSRNWDHDKGGRTEWVAWMTEVMRECYRLLKPGGYAVVWSLPRTCHWTAWAMEDAGFIIRDQLAHIFASGFPKGKAQLKPAREDWWLARKPGPLRPLAIDESRIPSNGETPAADRRKSTTPIHYEDEGRWKDRRSPETYHAERPGEQLGRWPSNVLLSDPELFDQPNPYVVGSGATTQSTPFEWAKDRQNNGDGNTFTMPFDKVAMEGGYGDSGGYSRFFIIPKADRADREPVLRGTLTETKRAILGQGIGGADNLGVERENAHPTVKPTDLMRHLVRLVTPSGGTILDPFLGSGSTALACELEGFPWIGIEKEPEYVAIAEARLNGTQRGLGLDVGAPVSRPPKTHPDLSKHQPKRRAPSENYTGGWTGTDEEPAA
jgi:hypothetical protein